MEISNFIYRCGPGPYPTTPIFSATPWNKLYDLGKQIQDTQKHANKCATVRANPPLFFFGCFHALQYQYHQHRSHQEDSNLQPIRKQKSMEK